MGRGGGEEFRVKKQGFRAFSRQRGNRAGGLAIKIYLILGFFKKRVRFAPLSPSSKNVIEGQKKQGFERFGLVFGKNKLC